ncbi:hypothetical protein DSC45_12050 [Streptomyces sp. YIM 130001]|uniref:hypothetical protein n=1 Tax=Streptomyces sp. YIM 130001 TaxID=2259644 RepID=UPI000E648BFA|nr:hypothetical protein [Streptomyces sp. YIM 130001]RII17624.1 hypothetical protein DSC45_12050 [Streptomyces sp. YIM 130001]
MSQQRLGRGPLRPPPNRGPGDPAGGRPAAPTRFVRWLGGFGCLAAGYAVFQSLVGVLPDGISPDTARYALATVAGCATAGAVWLSTALLRARAATPAPGLPSPRPAPGQLPAGPGELGPGAFTELARETYATLVTGLTETDDPQAGRLTGWPHGLDEPTTPLRPTSVGTAYGLHTVLDLGLPDGRIRTGELVDTLWRLRLADGGWAARSQGSVPRPEVTALVLGALARAGADPVRVADEAEYCVSRLTRELEPSGLEMTHVVTTVLRGLLRAAPESAALPQLREALVDAAFADPLRQHQRCWGPRFSPVVGRPVLPSPVHTAQAVLALDRAAAVLGETPHVRDARREGIRWLLACPGPLHDGCPDLRNVHEVVRRPSLSDLSHHEVLPVRHFTASWVLRALLTTGSARTAAEDGLEREWRELTAGAAAAVWRQQTDGVWTWEGDGDDLGHPMWMTYQGLSALRTHALWMYQPHV